jgi:hypothetical protein
VVNKEKENTHGGSIEKKEQEGKHEIRIDQMRSTMHECTLIAIGVFLYALLASGPCFAQTLLFQGTSGSTAGCSNTTNTYWLTTPYYVTSVPAPVVSITLSQNNITFTANTIFIPENARYVMSFSLFYGGLYSSSSLTNPGSCDNNDGFFAVNNFTSWWTHLNNALNLTQAYAGQANANYHNANWTVVPTGCANATYSLTIPVPTLSTCKNPDGSAALTFTQNSTNGNATLRGTFYVNVVSPANIFLGELAGGYVSTAFAYPFIATTASNSVIVQGSAGFGGTTLYEMVGSQAVLSGTHAGELEIQFTSQMGMAYAPSFNYGFVIVIGIYGAVNMTIPANQPTLPSAIPNTQNFTAYSSSVHTGSAYVGTYIIAFKVYLCQTSSLSYCTTTLQNYTTPVDVVVTSIDTESGFFFSYMMAYLDPGYTIPYDAQEALYDGQTMYLQVTVTTNANGAPEATGVHVVLDYVATCTNPAIPYNGVNNLGCVNATYSAPLVVNNVVTTNLIIQNYYNFAFITNNQTGYARFSFNVHMYTPSQNFQQVSPLPFYLHIASSAIELGATQVSKRLANMKRVSPLIVPVLPPPSENILRQFTVVARNQPDASDFSVEDQSNDESTATATTTTTTNGHGAHSSDATRSMLCMPLMYAVVAMAVSLGW